ncbi:MAG: helix-turn-helix domain-containing protein [Marinifilaceae bacterium]
MLTTIHTTVSVVNILTMFICGFILLVAKFNSKIPGQMFKSRIILAACFELVAFASLFIFLWGDKYFNAAEVFALPILIMSIVQSCILFFGIMMMVAPQDVTIKKVLKMLAPAAAVMILYGISIFFEKDYVYTNLGDFVRHVYKIPVLLRLCMFVVFMNMLFQYYKQYRLVRAHKRINPFTQNEIQTNVLKAEQRIVNTIFYTAFGTGVVACVYMANPEPILYIVVTIVMALVYVAFTLSFIHLGYSNAMTQYKQSANRGQIKQTSKSTSFKTTKTREATPIRTPKDDSIKQTLISMIVDEHFFTQPNITINDVAERLNITPRALATYISTEYEQSFVSWINELRIEYAKQCIYESGPNYILDVENLSNQVGFSNTEEFNGFFKDYTSKTPVDYVNLLKATPKTQR